MRLAHQKNGLDQAWERSRGGLITKIRAATINEKRNRIERFFNKTKVFRRIATRDDKLGKPSLPLSKSFVFS